MVFAEVVVNHVASPVSVVSNRAGEFTLAPCEHRRLELWDGDLLTATCKPPDRYARLPDRTAAVLTPGHGSWQTTRPARNRGWLSSKAASTRSTISARRRAAVMITGRVAKWPWRRCDFPRASLAASGTLAPTLAPSQPAHEKSPCPRKPPKKAAQSKRKRENKAPAPRSPPACPERPPALLLPPVILPWFAVGPAGSESGSTRASIQAASPATICERAPSPLSGDEGIPPTAQDRHSLPIIHTHADECGPL